MHKRLTDLENIDESAIDAILDSGDDVTIQYSAPRYSREVLSRIDSLCARHGERLEVRFFGHGSGPFDCVHLRDLPSVRALAVDCMGSAAHLEVLWTLQHLTQLCLGVDQLDQRNILEGENLQALTKLVIGQNRRRNIDLSPLTAMRHLKYLHIVGHAGGIEAVATLHELQRLRLSMLASSVRLDFVRDVAALRHLTLILGGREDIGEVGHPSLTSLEVIRVRGLSKLTPASFPRLTELAVEDQIRLASLEFSEANSDLKRIRLINCKGLGSLIGLERLPALDHLRVYRTALRLEDLLARGLPSTLRIMAFYTGKARVDREIRKELDRRGWGSGVG